MKKYFYFFVFWLFIQVSWAQVGIGTTTPDATVKLDVRGPVKIMDGTEGDEKILVSDSTGKASWENVNDGVKTRVIHMINQGTGEVTIWSHPENIEVRFKIRNPNNDMVTVENKSTDATHYWNVVIMGGATGRETLENVNYKADYIRDDGTDDSLEFDLGTNKTGWFRIICTDEKNEKDGFTMDIMFYDDDINGIVQYWDEP